MVHECESSVMAMNIAEKVKIIDRIRMRNSYETSTWGSILKESKNGNIQTCPSCEKKGLVKSFSSFKGAKSHIEKHHFDELCHMPQTVEARELYKRIVAQVENSLQPGQQHDQQQDQQHDQQPDQQHDQQPDQQQEELLDQLPEQQLDQIDIANLLRPFDALMINDEDEEGNYVDIVDEGEDYDSDESDLNDDEEDSDTEESEPEPIVPSTVAELFAQQMSDYDDILKIKEEIKKRKTLYDKVRKCTILQTVMEALKAPEKFMPASEVDLLAVEIWNSCKATVKTFKKDHFISDDDCELTKHADCQRVARSTFLRKTYRIRQLTEKGFFISLLSFSHSNCFYFSRLLH